MVFGKFIKEDISHPKGFYTNHREVKVLYEAFISQDPIKIMDTL